MPEPILEISDLRTVFRISGRDVAAVQDVALTIAPGETVALVGESGSGKSTVLRAVMGLVPDFSGTILVDGFDTRRTPRRDLIARVQMVFQDPYSSLHPRYPVGEALAEVMRINRIPHPERRTVELLELIGQTEAHRFRFPHELSGGQRQRVAIARALALNPKVLLLDEPTSALDVSIQAEVLNLLERLRRELGLTYVIVSHNLAVISHMCDRLAVMQMSEVVETMTHKDLVTRRMAHDYSRALVAASETAG